ncbi:hypothetical protein [Nioella aestuarii]|uniref:hypothetical protein n=1 Tax=Nioella aestuarii TaxID=1662864 RepID=UPI003D7F4C17
MPVSRRLHAICGLCLSMCLGFPALADDPPVTSAFRMMLDAMPDVADAPAGAYQIDFGDVRMARVFLERAGAVPVDAEDRAMMALLRGGTQIFARSASADESSFRSANGFGFADVETNLQYARPPMWLNMVSLGFGTGASVAQGLPEAGFTPEERHGQSVFWRGEQDYAVMQPDLPPDDLYGGAVRRSVRLALSGDVLAFSNGWPVLDTVLTPDLPRVTEDGNVRTLLDALDLAAHEDEHMILASLFIDILPAEYPSPLITADLFGDDGHVTLVAFLPTYIIPARDQVARLQANLWGVPINSEGDGFAEIIDAEAEVLLIEADQPAIVIRLETAVDPDRNRLVLNRGYGAFQSLMMRRDFDRLLNDIP